MRHDLPLDEFPLRFRGDFLVELRTQRLLALQCETAFFQELRQGRGVEQGVEKGRFHDSPNMRSRSEFVKAPEKSGGGRTF